MPVRCTHTRPHSCLSPQEVSAADLPLVRLGIECTLSQLLETGVMHADPHGGNHTAPNTPYDPPVPTCSHDLDRGTNPVP